MNALAELRYSLNRAARRIIGPAAAACLVAYFAYYAVYGDRGLMSLQRLEGEIAAAEQLLEKVRQERKHIEHKVSLLRPESLDPDMLDERARAVLNYTLPSEVVILAPRSGFAPTFVSASVPAGSR